MLFQQSQKDGWLYDIISLGHADENDKVTRKVVDSLDQISEVITKNYDTVPYEEATGKTAPGKHWVTLTKAEDEKGMVILFLLERAWTLSTIAPEDKLRALQLEKETQPEGKAKEIDTGQSLTCPVCGDKFRLKHIEGARVRHALRKP
jgi:hypothetical protein